MMMKVVVDPAEAGTNDIRLSFHDHAGKPVTVDAVKIDAATSNIPSRRLDVTPIGPNEVSAQGHEDGLLV